MPLSILTVSILSIFTAGQMTGMQAQMSDADIVRTAASAAPADISAAATIVQPAADGTMRVVRAGTNGWVCMAHPEVMCLDKAWQGWAEAWMNKRQPPALTSLGFAYMLQGDVGVSNTDPYATAKTDSNAWVVSPAHLMVLVPDAKLLDTLPTDPFNGGPWVMWKGTPYAHVMVPVVPMKKQ